MTNTSDYHITQELRAETKLFQRVPIYVKDLLIIVSIMAVITMMKEFVTDVFRPVYYMGSLLISFIIVAPSSMNPKRRIYESVFLYLRRDKATYYPMYMKERMDMITSNTKKKKTKLISDELPVEQYNTQYQCFQTNYGYMNIAEIITKDLVNAPEDEILFDIAKLTRFNVLEYNPYKIIGMNFPCNTERQQQFLKYKMQKNKNPDYQRDLEYALRELEWVQEHKTKREFYHMYFSDSLDGIKKVEATMKASLNVSEAMIGEISQGKKEKIMHRLNNPASVLTGGNDDF